MPAVWPRCDVHEGGRFLRLEDPPDTLWHDRGVLGVQRDSGLGTDGVLVSVDQLDAAADAGEVLVTVGMDLAGVRRAVLEVRDDPMVYPSRRCGGPGGAGTMLLSPWRLMLARWPSKGTADGSGTAGTRRKPSDLTASRRGPGEPRPEAYLQPR